MLLWSPSAQFDPLLFNCDKLFWRLLLGVLLGHVIILVGYGIFSRRQPLIVHVTRTNLRSNQAITVLPFVRRTGQLERVFKRPAASRRVQINSAPVSEKKVQVAKKISKHVRGKLSPKNKLVVKKSSQKFEKKNKKNKKITPEKKTKKAIEPKIVEKEPAAVQPKIKPKKHAVAEPPVAKSRVVEPAPEEPVVHEPAVMEPIAQEVSALPGAISGAAEPAVTGPEELNIDLAAAIDTDQSPIELGQEEFDALQTYRAIHDELSKNWHPPARLQPKQPCVILVSVDEHGAVKQLHIEQASGILAYDIAARLAVNSSVFPETIWGQNIRLHF